MNAHELVNVGESALVVYDNGELDLDDGSGLTGPLTVNIHLEVDKLIIYRRHEEDDENGLVYVADFVRFEEAEAADGFRARFADVARLGEAEASWFSFSGRSDTAPFHIQPNPAV